MIFDATTPDLTGLGYLHLDVFTDHPRSGNGVIVFPDATGLDGDSMLLLTREMRQFESIFLITDPLTGSCRARISTTEEELEFAGPSGPRCRRRATPPLRKRPGDGVEIRTRRADTRRLDPTRANSLRSHHGAGRLNVPSTHRRRPDPGGRRGARSAPAA
jgi:hypothetical protein